MKACLSVCSNAGKALAAALNKPLVGVHHMVYNLPVLALSLHTHSTPWQQAHALTPFLSQPVSEHPKYPFLTLLISGGHTLLLLAESPTRFKTLATTSDISIGNAYDRVSRLLGIEWGSLGPGAALEKFCADHPLVPSDCEPMSMLEIKSSIPNRGQLMFSYAGMCSAFQRCVEDREGLTGQRKVEIAWAFQRHAVEQLEEKLCVGLRWCEKHAYDIKSIVVSGGVASNLYLRERYVMCTVINHMIYIENQVMSSYGGGWKD